MLKSTAFPFTPSASALISSRVKLIVWPSLAPICRVIPPTVFADVVSAISFISVPSVFDAIPVLVLTRLDIKVASSSFGVVLVVTT